MIEHLVFHTYSLFTRDNLLETQFHYHRKIITKLKMMASFYINILDMKTPDPFLTRGLFY